MSVNKQKIRSHFAKAWGKYNSTRLSEKTMEGLKEYADRYPGEITIDDITWRDLDMDRIFTSIDTTASSCGDSMLYRHLRHPDADEKGLRELNALSDAFSDNKDMRFTVQTALAGIGREKDMPAAKRIEGIFKAREIGSAPYIILSLLTLIDIICFFIFPMYAILAFIPLAVINIVLSLKVGSGTSGACDGFDVLLKMLKAADAAAGSRLPLSEERKGVLEHCLSVFAKFRRGSFFVTSRSVYSEGLGEALLQYLKIFFHIDLIKFDQMLKICQAHRMETDELNEILGDIDCACALASLRKALPVNCRPDFDRESAEAYLDIRDMGHPLIGDPVRQDFSMRGGQLITGSNASGKSTFLKNTALSAVLAQALGFVPGSYYHAPVFRIMTSMALTDDLMAGESYFVVELRSLKRILDAADEKTPLLCIVDEVLRGTNTIERIAASSEILKALVKPGVLPLAATHDIELSRILEKCYTNRHFTEEIRNGDIHFPYRLLDGPSDTRNAISLLSHFGYDELICRKASERAAYFEEKGEWSLES